MNFGFKHGIFINSVPLFGMLFGMLPGMDHVCVNNQIFLCGSVNNSS